MEWQERAKELVEAHWSYHDILIPIFLDKDPVKYRQAKAYWGEWYKAIGIHFYKHAIEDIKDGVIKIDARGDSDPDNEPGED